MESSCAGSCAFWEWLLGPKDCRGEQILLFPGKGLLVIPGLTWPLPFVIPVCLALPSQTGMHTRRHLLIFLDHGSLQLGLQPPKETLDVLRLGRCVLQQPLGNVLLLRQPAVGRLQVGVDAPCGLLLGF